MTRYFLLLVSGFLLGCPAANESVTPQVTTNNVLHTSIIQQQVFFDWSAKMQLVAVIEQDTTFQNSNRLERFVFEQATIYSKNNPFQPMIDRDTLRVEYLAKPNRELIRASLFIDIGLREFTPEQIRQVGLYILKTTDIDEAIAFDIATGLPGVKGQGEVRSINGPEGTEVVFVWSIGWLRDREIYEIRLTIERK